MGQYENFKDIFACFYVPEKDNLDKGKEKQKN